MTPYYVRNPWSVIWRLALCGGNVSYRYSRANPILVVHVSGEEELIGSRAGNGVTICGGVVPSEGW
jgi:hypothetical protein